jgi:hypothetical protein
MTKQELIAKLESMETIAPSFLSVESVLKMLKDLEEPQAFDITDITKANQIVQNVVDDMTAYDKESMYYIDDYELEMNGKEVEISEIYFNTDKISHCVLEAIKAVYL